MNARLSNRFSRPGQSARQETVAWIPGLMLAMGLLMSAGLLLLIAVNGTAAFWPQSAYRLEVDPAGAEPPRTVFGLGPSGLALDGQPRGEFVELKPASTTGEPARVARWDSDAITAFREDPDLAVIETRTLGRWIIEPVAIRMAGNPTCFHWEPGFPDRVLAITRKSAYPAELSSTGPDEETLRERMPTPTPGLLVRTADQGLEVIALAEVDRIFWPNTMAWWERAFFALDSLRLFLTEYPRAANTEGGILPALAGTLALTVLMSLAVAPLGVLAALYLHEYARQGALVQAIRVSVNNLAGVPSIILGVFGLGFFVYGLGGSIDTLLFPGRQGPVFGTGGILWAALTLALLTVPVVIVATEEALASVPRGIREASYGCGASRWQTTRNIVLPAAAPGVLTGLILAMARAAGEVAPIMLVGAVKVAPQLPVDGDFPFLHLDRKFMHLGFHIYDLAFQSPDAEAVRPVVFATALLLIGVVLSLNGGALLLRHRLRRNRLNEMF